MPSASGGPATAPRRLQSSRSAQSLISNTSIKRPTRNGLLSAAEFLLSNLDAENLLVEVDAITFPGMRYPEAAHLWAVSAPRSARWFDDVAGSLAGLDGKKLRTYNARIARLALPIASQ